MFERGFKTWCEKQSLELRKELKKPSHDPLDSRALAKHLKIRVLLADEVKGVPAASRQLLRAEDSGWSAVTINDGDRKLIILNDTHSLARQSSDLTHELAHHLCGHAPASLGISEEGLMMLESYSRKDEEEADWLSGCLLLPRPALVHIKRRYSDIGLAAQHYMVSAAMLKYRLDVTGVNYQYRS